MGTGNLRGSSPEAVMHNILHGPRSSRFETKRIAGLRGPSETNYGPARHTARRVKTFGEGEGGGGVANRDRPGCPPSGRRRKAALRLTHPSFASRSPLPHPPPALEQQRLTPTDHTSK